MRQVRQKRRPIRVIPSCALIFTGTRNAQIAARLAGAVADSGRQSGNDRPKRERTWQSMLALRPV